MYTYKIIFLALLLIKFAYKIVLHSLSNKQVGRPLPASVADIYDAEEYDRWKKYKNKQEGFGLVSGIATLLLNIVLYCTDIISVIYYALPGGEIAKAILFFLIMCGVEMIISFPFDYYFNFKIEAEFGFNKATVKTMITDAIKNLIVGVLLYTILFLLVFGAYALLGAYFGIIALVGIGLVMVIISSLSTVISKLFNKFTPLPEGELRDTLCKMFSDAGFKLKDIYVMDASKRTTKANAYCGGIGKMKQIVIYDNLLNNYTDGEITAVFAHELAHFKHKDTTALTSFGILNFLPVMAMMTVFMLVPEISASYGFAIPSILFAFYMAMGGPFDILSTLLMIPFNAISRAMERRADTFAVKQGYGDDLVSALKRLHKDSLSNMNPHPTVVKLEYNHPPLHERISLVEELKK